MRKICVAITLALCCIVMIVDAEAAPAGISTNSKTQAVDGLFEHLNEGTKPGAAVMVISDGQIVYQRGFGFANIAAGERVGTGSVFRLGSVSKQFTSTAVMVLVEQGKLKLDDPVVDYLPGLTNFPGVTIRNLLTHTAGIPDYYDDVGPDDGILFNKDVVEHLSKMDERQFAPGEQFEYSNPAYEVLSHLIEVVSGMRFGAFMEKYVFQPAGMPTAVVLDSTQPEIPQRVYGYDCGTDIELNDDHYLNGIVGSGGVYATLGDMYAWDQALQGDAVLSPGMFAEAFTEARLNNGDGTEYGLGWTIDTYKGHKRISHGGSWVGFRAEYVRFPEQNLSVVVLSNCSSYEPGIYAQQISDIYLPASEDEFQPAASRDQVQWQQSRLRKDDIWWTVNGRDMAWNFKNLHQIMPTVNVYRHGAVRELESAPVAEIASWPVVTPAGEMPFDEFIHSDYSTVLGVIVLRKGKIAYESYPRMQDYEMPVYWSVAKSFVGTVVRILEERGEIDVSAPIDWYIPEIADSALAGTSVRDILDMASGLDCADEYADKDACYYRYSMGIGDGFRTPDAPADAYEFVKTLKAKREAEPGTRFSYSGLNTFVLAWLVENVTGLPFQDVFSREVWYHIGAESNASYIAPVNGIAVTHGGFMARLRDVARLGLLFTPSYSVVSDRQIISDEHIDFLQNAGRPELLENAGAPPSSVSGIKHNIYQWDEIGVNGDLWKGGWAWQGLLINPQRDVVVVFTGYFKDDEQGEITAEPIIRSMVDGVFAD